MLMSTLCDRVVAMHADLRFDTTQLHPAADAADDMDWTDTAPPPLLLEAQAVLQHWTALYEARALKGARAAAEGVPASQRTQMDDDGDVVMYGNQLITVDHRDDDMPAASSSTDLNNNSDDEQDPPDDADDGNRDGQNPADPQEPPAWSPPEALAMIIPAPLLIWAREGTPTMNSAVAAIVRAATSSPAKTNCEKALREAGVLPSQEERRVDSNGDPDVSALLLLDAPPVQRELTGEMIDAQLDGLDKDLRRSGSKGKLVRAQFRSQRGPGAMTWLRAPPGQITPANAAIMIMVSVMVDPYRLSGTTCPFSRENRCGATDGPTSVHAIGCPHQHIRGHVATHTQMKRCLQRSLTSCNASWWTNEDTSVFRKPGFKMDTVLAPGALSLASDEEYAMKGVLLDNSIRAPTAGKYLEAGEGKGAAFESGFAAKKGEKDKIKHYITESQSFDTDRWVLVPFVQESFGRFGKAALNFVRILASHSAACRGGNVEVIQRRQGIITRQILTQLSLCLARELAERVQAYMRGAIMAGRRTDPVSALLRP